MHHVQARLSREGDSTPVTVVSVEGRRATLVAPDGDVETIWHHRPLGDQLTPGQVVGRRPHGVLALSGAGAAIRLLCVRVEG